MTVAPDNIVLVKTDVQTPMQVFHLPQHLLVPLFQRPYVWDEDEQWAPLWHDIRRVVELRLANPHAEPTHFLGAVVLQSQENTPGHLPESAIIDGQQRITTLQLVVDAVATLLEETGDDMLAGRLAPLTRNQANFVSPGDSDLKLRHANRDREAFVEVMSADAPIDHASLRHAGSKLTRAHEYFFTTIKQWLGGADDDAHASRADALVATMTNSLQLVVISLTATENSQEIFETLNARGTPLTAADLIKNFVFQRLAAEGVDTSRAYAEDWPFDTKFWETEVSVGRYLISRSSLFLNQWLIATTGEEVGPQSTFSRFKSFVEHDAARPIRELLPEIKAQADRYEGWTLAASDRDAQLDPVEMCVYRMGAADTEVLKPVLLWLHAPGLAIPSPIVHEIVAMLESWIMRRQLLRLTGSDLGRIVADLIRSYRSAAADDLPELVRRHLTRLNVTSTYWPGDEEVRRTLLTEPAYRRFKRGRLRMFLEAVENTFRSVSGQPQIPRRGYPIEHILPQSWGANWPVDDPAAEEDRAAHVHRLGNLTLLTKSLNSRVSNGPWRDKRSVFAEHNTILLTGRLLTATGDESWDEDAIDARTTALVEALLTVWPVPDDHEGSVADARARSVDGVEVKDLLRAGLLSEGTVLTARPGTWGQRTAIVTGDGRVEVDGRRYDSPSGAAKHVRGGAANGWYFWRLSDGRMLQDVRSAYQGSQSNPLERFDWTPLHVILESLPDGSWTTYGALASVLGTAAQPVGNHITNCPQCTNAHRVLTSSGSVAAKFTWTDATDTRDPAEMLAGEGVEIRDGKADPARELGSDELAELIGG